MIKPFSMLDSLTLRHFSDRYSVGKRLMVWQVGGLSGPVNADNHRTIYRDARACAPTLAVRGSATAHS